MTILAALIVSAGALFGIWLGAYYAAGRLGAQLHEQGQWFKERREEDSRRLERQLAAETDRLEKQLEHDREMRDRDELRTTLDKSIATMGSAVNGVFEVLAAADVYFVINKAIHEHLTSAQPLTDPDQAAVAAVYGMGNEHRRLRFRLPGHAITKQYATVRGKAIEILANPALVKDSRSGQESLEIKEAFEELKGGAEQFIRLASDLMTGRPSKSEG